MRTARLARHIDRSAELTTDDSGLYRGMGKHLKSHDVVKHMSGEYVRRRNGCRIHTNTVERFFSILKRGIVGTFHHVSKKHLHRYLSEFDFRYNAREVSDGERAVLAVKATEAKRLMYRDSCASA